MKKSILSLVMPVLLLLVAIGLGSCKKNREVKAVITVMHDTVDIVGLDTLGQPMFDTIISEVTGASVRMWSDQIGSNIDTTIETNTSGQAEFEFEHVAILRLNVMYFSQEIDAGYVILEEGEVIEREINLNEY